MPARSDEYVVEYEAYDLGDGEFTIGLVYRPIVAWDVYVRYNDYGEVEKTTSTAVVQGSCSEVQYLKFGDEFFDWYGDKVEMAAIRDDYEHQEAEKRAAAAKARL